MNTVEILNELQKNKNIALFLLNEEKFVGFLYPTTSPHGVFGHCAELLCSHCSSTPGLYPCFSVSFVRFVIFFKKIAH